MPRLKLPFPHGQCVDCGAPLLRAERRSNGHQCDKCEQVEVDKWQAEFRALEPDERTIELFGSWTIQ